MTLKTLKDIELLFSDRIKLANEFELWAKENKAENCTLNIITWFQTKLFKCQRQEAIKWIKELDKELKLFRESAKYNYDIKCSYERMNKPIELFESDRRAQIYLIKILFNITYEELK